MHVLVVAFPTPKREENPEGQWIHKVIKNPSYLKWIIPQVRLQIINLPIYIAAHH